MSHPMRLLEEDGDPYETLLLRSVKDDGMSPQQRRRVLAGLGLTNGARDTALPLRTLILNGARRFSRRVTVGWLGLCLFGMAAPIPLLAAMAGGAMSACATGEDLGGLSPDRPRDASRTTPSDLGAAGTSTTTTITNEGPDAGETVNAADGSSRASDSDTADERQPVFDSSVAAHDSEPVGLSDAAGEAARGDATMITPQEDAQVVDVGANPSCVAYGSPVSCVGCICAGCVQSMLEENLRTCHSDVKCMNIIECATKASCSLTTSGCYQTSVGAAGSCKAIIDAADGPFGTPMQRARSIETCANGCQVACGG